MFEVEWTTTFNTAVNMDEIIRIYKKHLENGHTHDESVERAILEEISGLDDAYYYSWNDEAERKVKEELERRIVGVQMKMELD